MYNKRKIDMIKERYPECTRICLDNMENDPNPIPAGTKGTVEFVDDCGTVFCKFDNGRSLGEDSFRKIQQEEELTEEISEELAEDPEFEMTM